MKEYRKWVLEIQAYNCKWSQSGLKRMAEEEGAIQLFLELLSTSEKYFQLQLLEVLSVL